jgi:PAS domain S-box-containing protein
MMAVSIWSFGYSLELWSGELSAILFWKKMKYIGIVIVPVAWFTFCLHYMGKEKWITTRNLLLLFIIPVFNLILLWSNQFHNLFYEYVSLNSTGPFITAYTSEGLGFWCNAAYSYILLFAGTLLLIIKSFSLSRLYLKQSIALLFGAITPLVGNALYITGLSPIPIDYDLTPLFFVVTGAALILSVFRFRFLDLVPIARDTIIENISDALLVFDKQNRIVDFNQIAKNIILEDAIHHPSESMMGKTVEEVFFKIPNLLNKFQDNAYGQTEVEIDTKKMNKKYYDTRISPLYDKHEQSVGHVMVLRDITERKKAYDTLQESEKRFQDVALSSADWIWEVDKDGKYTFASGKAKEILGYEPSELIGKTHFDLMPEDEAKRVGEIFKEIISEKKPIVDLENWNLSKQGEKVNLLTNGVPLLNESGELIGYRGVDKDITKHKIAEEELKKAHEMLMVVNSDLERKVEERTAEIEKLLKQKDEFIGQLGHDLKNPLGPLINLIPILEKKETDPESKKILEILKRNANHMKNLVVNTVALGRLNSPNVKFNLEDTNLLDEINDVIERNSLLFEENNIEIENKAGKNIILKTDKLRLTELFDNLIGNSVKYSPDGGTITIDAKQDKDFVTVSIRDIGMGVTEEQLGHIFDEFYKADESRHDFDSSGLGLPICKRIVEKHGGKIWAESLGEGKGTTMFFTLPVSSKKADDGKTD